MRPNYFSGAKTITHADAWAKATIVNSLTQQLERKLTDEMPPSIKRQVQLAYQQASALSATLHQLFTDLQHAGM